MQHINRKWIGICAGLLVLAALGSVVWWKSTRDDSLLRLQHAGVIRVGYAVGAPFADVDARGIPYGLAIDGLGPLVRSLGVARIEWVQTVYSELIPDLLDRRFDVIAAQLIISPQRQRKVHFSDPVTAVRYDVLVPRGNPDEVPPYSRLGPREKLTVAIVHESMAEEELRARGFTDESLKEVPESDSGEAALRVGSVTALVLTDRAVQNIVASHPTEFELVADTQEPSATRPVAWMGNAFHPDDAALLRAWNQALKSASPGASTEKGPGP